MRLLTIYFLLFIAPTQTLFSQCCNISLELQDSWGDGWNGASLDVYIDGTEESNYTLPPTPSGSFASYSINVCDGEVFEIEFNSGSFDGEITYELINDNGIIFSDGPSPNTGNVFTSNNVCSLTPSCLNTVQFGTATAPNDNSPTQISSCLWQNEYNTLNSVVAGETYVSSTDCGGFITVRSGSPGGPVVASGNNPLSWTATTNGTHYIHYNTNSSCGTASICCTTIIECTSCPEPTIPPQDCEGAIMVCDDNTFNGDAVDYGDVYEIDEPNNTECGMNSENQSTWFYVNIGTAGTLEMTIDPANGTDDYDWAIWGPYTESTAGDNCPPIDTPIRCNTSANTSLTGMNSTATNNYEYPGSSTYQWSNPINADAGDIYILMIDNWSGSGNPFSLDWGGTSELSCTEVNLPVDLIDFSGINNGIQNSLFWSTASEKNNDYFILEYSATGTEWKAIDNVNGAGTTTSKQHYSTTHRDYKTGTNYYRLTQVDYDGTETIHKIISIDNSEERTLLKRVNTMGQEVNESYRGIVILYYSNGSTEKMFQK